MAKYARAELKRHNPCVLWLTGLRLPENRPLRSGRPVIASGRHPIVLDAATSAMVYAEIP
jgi:adenylylsulfate kinase-like enzyme